jgi:hypothetical protein
VITAKAEKKKCECGVYQIRNVITGDCYIGGSSDLRMRERNHFSKLRHGVSFKRLNRSVRKHGVRNHVFEVLEYCSPAKLRKREDALIKKHRPALNRHMFGTVGHPPCESESLSVSFKFDKQLHGFIRAYARKHKCRSIPDAIRLCVVNELDRNGIALGYDWEGERAGCKFHDIALHLQRSAPSDLPE